MEDLSRVDHALQPRAIAAGPLHRKQQRQQTALLSGACILPQSLPQRKMLSFRLRRQPRRIGGQKGEGRVLIVAVLGKIEVHTADQVPRGITALKEVLDLASELGQLAAKGVIQFLP